MSLLDRFKERRARLSLADEDVKLKIVRNALAGALDEEAEKLNDGRAIEYGSTRTKVSQATREAQDLGSYVRKLEPRDPRIEEALLFDEAGLLAPLDDRARAVLAEAWPGGFDADAKLDALMKALHESRETR
ncbi:MAG: hypothetical protein ABSC51_10140 [Gaiellaceae bacterium]|jgi:hypothetical protein